MAEYFQKHSMKKWPWALITAVLGIAIIAAMHLAALNGVWPGVRRGYYRNYKMGGLVIWATNISAESHGYYDSCGEWIEDGQQRVWSRAGVLIHESQMRDGAYVGTMIIWNSDGTLMETTVFSEDYTSPTANHERYEAKGVPANGVITYYDHGKLLRSETYSGGVLKERVEYE